MMSLVLNNRAQVFKGADAKTLDNHLTSDTVSTKLIKAYKCHDKALWQPYTLSTITFHGTRPVTGTGQLACQGLAHHIKNFYVKTLTLC